MIDPQEQQKLRGLPIVGVAERLGLRVKRNKCLCPFHNDHQASLSFNITKNKCRCFVCMDESLGPIDLVMRMQHMKFAEACRWLADENNIILQSRGAKEQVEMKPPPPFDASRYARFFEHPRLSAKSQNFLFGERLLSPEVVSWCRLTSWQDRQGVNWLQIPYYDQDGMLIGIQNRNLDYQKDAPQNLAPRFRFPQGANCSIYNLRITASLRPGEQLFITEGASDCWSMMSAGHKAIAIPSATLLKPADRQFLLSLSDKLSTQFHMFPDLDEPGRKLAMLLQEILPNLELHQLPVGCKDFSDYYVATKKRGFAPV